jgi:hypothetical protein
MAVSQSSKRALQKKVFFKIHRSIAAGVRALRFMLPDSAETQLQPNQPLLAKQGLYLLSSKINAAFFRSF